MKRTPPLLAAVCGALCIAGAADAAPVSTIRLAIDGGARPGTWRIREARGVCAEGFSLPGEWSVRYGVPSQGARRLGSLQLFVPAGRDADGSARQFGLSISIGPLASPAARYDVETRLSSRRRTGSGTASIVDRGTSATVTFDAKTGDGATLRGVVDCGLVERAAGP